MLNSLKALAQIETATVIFYLMNILFWVPLVLTTLYCYGRLDYARSYEPIKTTPLKSIESNVNNTRIPSAR